MSDASTNESSNTITQKRLYMREYHRLSNGNAFVQIPDGVELRLAIVARHVELSYGFEDDLLRFYATMPA